MIIEAMVAGITFVFVSSLVFANTQIKRQRQWEKEDNAPPPPPPPQPRIYPFLEIKVGTPCPKCKRLAKNQVLKRSGGYVTLESAAEGPAWPTACDSDTCKAKHLPHLHARCYTCNYYWFMAPADESKQETPKEEKKETANDNRQPHTPGAQ